MKRDQGIVHAGVRAIDVGYFSVKYTLGRKQTEDGSVIETDLFPSLAPRISGNAVMETPGTGRTDGCIVEVDGVRYFVGRGADYYSTGLEPRPVLEDYCESDKYLALMRGALHYMALDAGASSELIIDRLVLGLPLNTYSKYRDSLRSRAQGEHLLGSLSGDNSHRRVTVKAVDVIVQPQGALLNFGFQKERRTADGWTLVVDPGGGTLDWYLSRGQEPNWQRSGAYPKSMLACANAVADRINPKWKDQFEIMQRIDTAIRDGNQSFKVRGIDYCLDDYRQSIDAVLEESVKYMLGVVGPTDSLDQLLLTGGGAKLFYRYIAETYPDLAPIIQIDRDSVFSNVRGFQVAGEYFQAPAR